MSGGLVSSGRNPFPAHFVRRMPVSGVALATYDPTSAATRQLTVSELKRVQSVISLTLVDRRSALAAGSRIKYEIELDAIVAPNIIQYRIFGSGDLADAAQTELPATDLSDYDVEAVVEGY